ncbi:MAG TPA: LuxR C-terminal-related transcriptional regulator [Polyangiaceae bacterium]|nr:LuxR C-terminal-related transcriptional regulator [Polyangiaceae bacterium]
MTDDQELRSEPRAETRTEAVRHDAMRSEAFDLALLWPELCSGSRRVVDTFSTDERSYVVLEYTGARRRIASRSLGMLERVLLGQSPKVVAADLSVSVATVAGAMRGALGAMGLVCRVSSLPILVVMAARAHCLGEPFCVARVSTLAQNHQKVQVVSAPRPDLRLPARLSNAELSVVRRLLEGSSHAQISSERGTSARTVANQLATAFRKLGVSGRGQLVDRLIHHTMDTHRAQRARTAATTPEALSA